MIYYLLLIVSIALTVCKSSVYNVYAKRADSSLFSTFTFNAVAYGSAAAIALVSLLASGGVALSAPTVVCALVYAGVVFSLQSVSIVAMRIGAMAQTSICVMYGMIIPALAGPIFWKEHFGIAQAIGIVMMLSSLWLLNDAKGEKAEKSSKRWWALAAVAFALSGSAGLLEKIHQSTSGKDERLEFVFIACLFMLLISTSATLVARGRTQRKIKPIAALGAPAGIIIGVYSTVNLTLAGALDSMIYFPVANGGAMLLTVLVSITVFKEAFDRKKLFGIILGLCGIVLLSIPV